MVKLPQNLRPLRAGTYQLLSAVASNGGVGPTLVNH